MATGKLVNDNIICPWHGYTYNVMDGKLIMDPNARLEMYPVENRADEVYLIVPDPIDEDEDDDNLPVTAPPQEEPPSTLPANSFVVSEIKPGQLKQVSLDGVNVTVYNVDGEFYATQDECTHAGGPLSEGELSGKIITCPWHFSCFDVTDGAVTCRPATEPLETYTVQIEGDLGQVSKRS